jgi:adenylate kinase family enzyme
MTSQEEMKTKMEAFREYIVLNEEVKKERMYGIGAKIVTETKYLDATKKVREFIMDHSLLSHVLWETVREEGTDAEKIAFHEMFARHHPNGGYGYILAQNLVIFDHIPRLLERVESLEKRLAVYEEKERLEQEEAARRKAEEERMAAEEEVWMKMVAEQNKMEEEDKFSKRVMVFEELKGLF